MRFPAVRRSLLAGLAALAVALPALPAYAAAVDALVTTGSPQTTFPQNKQNEPSITRAPFDGATLMAGSNDEIDLAPCHATSSGAGSCPFTPGVGLSGVYFSFDNGGSWQQPTYTGFSARTGTGVHGGPIGTLPWYDEAGLVSNGDPILASGPVPGADGKFSWSNGRRYYYSNLAGNAPGSSTLVTPNFAVAVSRIDNPNKRNFNVKTSWSTPVIASGRLNPVLFDDKNSMWADNAESSTFFGRVYVSWTAFRAANSSSPNAEPEPIMSAFSSDGGVTWSNPVQITPATNNGRTHGRQGSIIRTDSKGTVYLFFEGAVPVPGTGGRQSAQMLARSFDGGNTFEKPQPVAMVTDVGTFDAFQGRFTFDGVAGARTDSFPSVDIANGAPTGIGATNEIVLGWSDGSFGNERSLVQHSIGGGSWSSPVAASAAADRPDFTAVAISPNGSNVYVTYDAFVRFTAGGADDYTTTVNKPRLMTGVVRKGSAGLTGFTDLQRGVAGDARASSANSLTSEFIGDYNYATASNTMVFAVFNDVRAGQVCQAVQDFRASIRGLPVSSLPAGVDWGEDNAASADAQVAALPRPLPSRDCPTAPRFGNSDIHSISG